MTILFSKAMPLIGELVYEKISPLKIKGLGGLTLGAYPISYAAAMFIGQKKC